MTPFDWGAERYLASGVALPAGALAMLRDGFDAILLGAMGDPRVPDNRHAAEILLGMRFQLDLYVNYRPVRLLHERLCPLRGQAQLDFVVFRENTEGQYNGLGGIFKKGTPDELAISEEINTRKGVERVIRAAFEWAKKNGKTNVVMADKNNAIPAHELWIRTFREVSAEYPGIEATHQYIDAMVLLMVRDPGQYQVIVTNNLFGDIVTDLGGALQGGLGMAASGNIHPGRTSLFEPVHGSAPPLAGKNVANPMGAILSAALLLQTNGWNAEARRIAQEAADFADQSPLPDADALYRNVWAELNPSGRHFFDGRPEAPSNGSER